MRDADLNSGSIRMYRLRKSLAADYDALGYLTV